MKKQVIKLFSLVVMLMAGFAMQSCEDECQEERTYISYEPVYMLHEELQNAVKSETPRILKEPGKIYLYGQWLLINERLKGVHVIDNSDPSNPQNVSFINIPGNVDMAVKNNILYADSYIDLLSIDISDPTNISVTSRTENAFQLNVEHGYWVDEERGVIVDWVEREITETVECGSGGGGIWLEGDVMLTNGGGPAPRPASGGRGGNSGSPSTGVGGSMARFTLVGDYLYTISDQDLYPFDVSTPQTPESLERINLGQWGIETIFPYNNHLFIGMQNGMQIYNLSNPLSPSHVSTYEHVQSCDPVVVQGDYAYVTLRDGNDCGGFTNQLEIINISDLSSPRLEHTYEMRNPHGLGIDGKCLFICEGEFGLKSFEVTDNTKLELKEFYETFHAYDVIPYNNNLMMIGEDGLFQFSYDCENELELLSVISIHRPN